MSIQTVTMKWTGVAPFLSHNFLAADPLSKQSKMLKSITSKRIKTDADHEQMAKIEFFAGLYMSPDGPIVPAPMIEGAIINGAKKVKKGVDCKAAAFARNHAQLIYDGPRTAEELWEDERFRHRGMVVVNKSKVFRTRPIFTNWSAVITIDFEDTILTHENILSFSKTAGAFCAIGDWRPRYGRFTAELC